MSNENGRWWGIGLTVTAGAALATMISSGAAQADATSSALAGALFDAQADGTTTPDDALTGANTNLTTGVTALVNELFHDPTNNVLAQPVALDDAALANLAKLEPAEDTILAHSGSMSSTIDELWFAPLNQQWLTASEAILSADQALADAVATDTGVQAAQLATAAASFQLLDAQLSSVGVELASIFFGGGDLTP
ncbi:MAG TPA: hypothetical protein VFR17_06675 [Mycobacterium sp.]|nr:hypothetical protein [Mycobacterium sp.]